MGWGSAKLRCVVGAAQPELSRPRDDGERVRASVDGDCIASGRVVDALGVVPIVAARKGGEVVVGEVDGVVGGAALARYTWGPRRSLLHSWHSQVIQPKLSSSSLSPSPHGRRR